MTKSIAYFYILVKCGVMFSMGIYIFETNCSDFYNNGSFYFEAGVALTCFIIDFMTAIKFYFISKKNKKNDSLSKQQQRKEKIFLIQVYFFNIHKNGP